MGENCCGEVRAGAEVCELNLEAGEKRSQVRLVCPECGKAGKAVQRQTVQALLRVSLAEVGDGAYGFCRTAGCQVVYFQAGGGQVFIQDQVRERVFQKEMEREDTPVCYCFQHTVGEVRMRGEAIVEEINAGIRAGKCACELRNPQGSCCLGNVRGLVKMGDHPEKKMRVAKST